MNSHAITAVLRPRRASEIRSALRADHTLEPISRIRIAFGPV